MFNLSVKVVIGITDFKGEEKDLAIRARAAWAVVTPVFVPDIVCYNFCYTLKYYEC